MKIKGFKGVQAKIGTLQFLSGRVCIVLNFGLKGFDMLRFLKPAGAALACAFLLVGCDSPPPRASATDALAEVQSRDNVFPSYPRAGRTYLSFDKAHGYQISYYDVDSSWLWYPGNRSVVPERWRRNTIRGIEALCFAHPDSYNPVTRTSGGLFKCSRLEQQQKTVVAELSGDVFDLASGRVPYALKRCEAPQEFTFDRVRFSC